VRSTCSHEPRTVLSGRKKDVGGAEGMEESADGERDCDKPVGVNYESAQGSRERTKPQGEPHMTDRELIDRANEIIERLFALDDAIANARGLRALLEDLHARDLSIVLEPHVAAIAMVRAGILRAAVSVVIACLDPKDRRGNRASVGQILDMLRDAKLVAVFPEAGTSPDSGAEVLRQVRHDYGVLVEDDLFKRGKRLRNDAIAHILIPDDPTPTVPYDTIYRLHDSAERLVVGLYRVCDRGTPQFLARQAQLIEHAKVFWDTYFHGMQSH